MSTNDEELSGYSREPYWPKEFPADTLADDPKFKLAQARQFLRLEVMDDMAAPGFFIRALEAFIDAKLAVEFPKHPE